MYKLTKKAEAKLMEIIFNDDLPSLREEAENLEDVIIFLCNIAIKNNKVEMFEKEEEEKVETLEKMLSVKEEYSVDEILFQVDRIAQMREAATKAKYIHIPNIEYKYPMDSYMFHNKTGFTQTLQRLLKFSEKSEFPFDENTIYTIEEWEGK